MASVYLAGPLFCQSETEYNIRVKAFLEGRGHTVHLPQSIDLGYILDDPDATDDEKSLEIFRRDLDMLDGCEVLVFLMDGRVPDEGAAVELGYAYAKGMTCIGLKTDIRTAESGRDNAMIVGAIGARLARNLVSLADMLDSLPCSEKVPGPAPGAPADGNPKYRIS